MKHKLLIALVAVVSGLLVWLTFFWNPHGDTSSSTPPSAKAPKGGDFTLQSADGPVALKDLRGKVVLIYFGYTYCPDICPTSLSITAQALSALDESELRQVKVLFVSVHPERDTVDKLKDYAAYFHPNIIGVTGSEEEVAAAAQLYGASYKKAEVKTDGAYVVDHSAYTYLVDQNGKLIASIAHATPAAEVLKQIRALLMQRLPAPPSPPKPPS